MDDKKRILEMITPKAVLKALTPEAIRAVPQASLVEGMICIRTFPFRVGRESRVKNINGKWERTERAKFDDRKPTNDLYLVDDGRLLNISREHFQIEKNGNDFELVDRGSACGTRVGDVTVGGHDATGKIPLADGIIIAVGSKSTPFLYQFVVLEGFEIQRG